MNDVECGHVDAGYLSSLASTMWWLNLDGMHACMGWDCGLVRKDF